MPLPSFLKRKDSAAAPKTRGKAAAEDGGPVEAARTRARRRLIGAVVLLAAGIVVFPLVFETQPRPVGANVPIEMPGANGANASGGATREAAPPARDAKPAKPRLPVVTEAPTELTPPLAEASAPAKAPAETVIAEAKPVHEATREAAREAPREAVREAMREEAPRPAPAAAPPKPAPASAPAQHANDGKRAQALLEGAAASQSQARSGRFVVQVGAYTDPASLKEARLKVEKLGLKTYTQVVETDAGKRTRVRVGPFTSREEADAAGSKLKGAGLPVAVLTL